MADRELEQGTVLHQRYEIFEVIGSGGFGITYRAFDRLLSRFVAVKEFFVAEWMERGEDRKECRVSSVGQKEKEKLEGCRLNFLREAKMMAGLKNIPYLSRIHDSFSENCTEYIVMKLLSGESLASYVKKNGKLAPGELLPMAEQVLFALEQMHERGFLHRDICPGNLIRTEDGDLYLIDLGAATACDRDSELWNTQVFQHKAFEAPEHLSSAGQGAWTDIYSFCATLVYLLTGDGVPAPDERKKSDAIPAMLMRTGLSAGQQNALLKGLVIDSGQRCAGARELRIALCGESAAPPQEWAVSFLARTDIGSREMNQDNLTADGLFYYCGTDFEKEGQILCRPDEIHLAAICDGVGGTHSGELASRAAVQALVHFLEQYRHSSKLPERLLDEFLDQLNEKVISLGGKIGTIATTLSLLVWKGKHYWCINIGDSPIYLYRGRKLKRMSVPQTKAYVQLMSGKPVSPADRHVLMNYLGKKGAAGSQMAVIRHGHLQKGDVFLLCSDGVSNIVNEEQLPKYLSKCEKNGLGPIWKVLVRKENRDNCSAVVLRF